MISKVSRAQMRQKKHRRLRNHIVGTAQRPRLCVFRSNNHMYAQIIDDTTGTTLVSASSLDMEAGGNKDAAKEVGALVAKKALEKGISEVVFDRGGYIYHGRIKELAEGAREAGLKF